jgi:hypothetical protein
MPRPVNASKHASPTHQVEPLSNILGRSEEHGHPSLQTPVPESGDLTSCVIHAWKPRKLIRNESPHGNPGYRTTLDPRTRKGRTSAEIYMRSLLLRAYKQRPLISELKINSSRILSIYHNYKESDLSQSPSKQTYNNFPPLKQQQHLKMGSVSESFKKVMVIGVSLPNTPR